jgi:acyl-CoA synthetase (AMP-forming)/AMP-acid ligase II
MTHLSELARTQAGQAAATAADGTGLTFAQLDDESRRLATLLEARGLQAGDTVAILLENIPRYLSAAWGALRAGLRIVPVNWHLSAAEAVYVAGDSGARALITSATLAPLASEIVASSPVLETRLVTGGPADGFEDFDAALGASSPERAAAEAGGQIMFYSSGTTGRPKGIKRTLPPAPFGSEQALETILAGLYGFGRDTVYLCTGPLYHAAPLGWSLGAQGLGGQVVVMPRFDPEACLAMIERFRVTHVQFVPTMFVRMLKLAPEIRARYDLSSLRRVVHAAAPCPVDVKRSIIGWLGPIVDEYYAASEGNCYFAIGSEEWLAHPGSVGRPLLGTPHILDDEGAELGAGEVGQIWIEGPRVFEYHNDAAKTAGAFNDRDWSTLGDLGHVDADGYLYLSDRRTDLIITGGVNVYPREIEDALAMHPAVAVIGLPDPEMGQEIRAIVQPAPGVTAGPELEQELIEHCAARLARFKRPRHVDFVADLPRLPSGKILRRLVRDTYLQRAGEPGGPGA